MPDDAVNSVGDCVATKGVMHKPGAFANQHGTG